MAENIKDKKPRLAQTLWTALVLAVCALGIPMNAYARYAATYRANSTITLTVKPGTYTLIFHDGDTIVQPGSATQSGDGGQSGGNTQSGGSTQSGGNGQSVGNAQSGDGRQSVGNAQSGETTQPAETEQSEETAAGGGVTYELACKRGETVTLPKVEDYFTRTGHTGAGWNTAADGSGKTFAVGETAADMAEADSILHLYAVWSVNSYHVRYDLNGGEDGPEPEIAYYGTVHTLSSQAPSREQYIFSGWFSQKEGGERLETVEITEDVTVFAHWKLDSVEITYVANLLPQGYTQVEWIRGDGASYIDTGLQLSGDSQIRVVYESEDTAGEDSSETVDGTTSSGDGSSTTDTADTGSGTETSSGDDTGTAQTGQSAGIIGIGGDIAFYAGLEDGKLSLNYGGADGGGSAAAESTVCRYTISPYVLSDESAASGKHELYANRHVWRIDGEEAAAFAYEQFEMTGEALVFGAGDVTGYFNGRIYGAQFMERSGLASSLVPAVSGTGEPGLYDIKRGGFYSNAGTGEFAVGPEDKGKSVEVVRGDTVRTEEYPFESNGYHLAGWATKPDGSGDSFLPGEDITVREDLTLYAVWEEQIPVLKSGRSWYDSEKGGDAGAYTEIRIVDRAADRLKGSADAMWYADDTDAGLITCYKEGTMLWIAGDGSGSIRMAADPEGMFGGFSGVAQITGLDLLDSSDCGSLAWLFSSRPSDTSQDQGGDTFFDGGMPLLVSPRGMEAWDVSKVSSMECAFAGCSSVAELYLDSWDTGMVTTFRGAFYGCGKLEHLDVSCWDTSKAADLSYAFCKMGCTAETSALDLTGWKIDAASDMTAMFMGCNKLRTIYVSYIWKADAQAADENMFLDCAVLTGEAGTAYSVDYTGKERAHIDSTEDPGYLTRAVARAVAVGKKLVFTYGGCEYAAGGVYKGAVIDAVYDIPVDSKTRSDVGWTTAEADVTRVKFEKNFRLFKPSSLSFWFYDMNKVKTLEGIGDMDVSEVTTMNFVFYQVACHEDAFDVDLSSWDVSNVTNFMGIFYRAGYYVKRWNVGDLGKWDMSSAQNLSMMFYEAGYDSSSWNAGDIGKWDVSHVTDFSWVLAAVCKSGSSWVVDLSGWDTSSAVYMSNMFNGNAPMATEWSVGDLKNWDVSHSTSLNGIFCNAGSHAREWTVGDISCWDTSSVTNLASAFSAAGMRSEKLRLDISGWNTSKVKNMYAVFEDAGAYTDDVEIIGFSNWDVSSVQDMSRMFRGICARGPELVLDLSGWKTSNVTNMKSMFERIYSLKTIYVGDGWDTSNVATTYSTRMFTNCKALVGGNGTAYDSSHTDKEYARIDTAENRGYLTAAPAAAVAAVSVEDADTGSGDLQKRYLEILLRYEDSLYDGASGAFTPGTSPVTGTYYASKEDWMGSAEYASWTADCEYLKTLLASGS